MSQLPCSVSVHPQSLATPPQWQGQVAQEAQVAQVAQAAVLLTPLQCQWLGPAASLAPPLALACTPV
jgi:hypothetical protein